MLLERCPWYVAGPLLGLVLVGFRAALNKPFGAFGGFIDVVEKKPLWSRLGVSGFVLMGMILGGAIYAGVTSTFHLTFSYGTTHRSLHERLLTLPDDVEIYPGHFSGSLCGTGLSGKPTSTIAFEKRWNPMLSMARDRFVEALANVPPKPAEVEAILSFNRGAGEPVHP